MPTPSSVSTFLFTDLEGSSTLWEREGDKMRPALAHHDATARTAVERNRGTVVKTSGDGIHAVFNDPVDAISAALNLQLALADTQSTFGITLRVRCGLHAGVGEYRDNDFFGTTVNRAARIMAVAHGGQVLLSQAVATLVGDRLPSGVTLRDLGVVRLRDLARSERVYQLSHPELRSDFPALRTLEATPNNLPQQVTSFIGRRRELVDVERLLGKTRLLTLTGVGGIGKTRLALQAAAGVMDDFSDGAWVVELAALADPQVVPLAVAAALRVKEDAGRPVAEAVLRFITDRKLLLILDNCEHLLSACAEFATQLLRAGPQLRILATSREPLHAPGESSYAVPALSLPELKQTVTPEEVEQSEAASLFMERAASAQPFLQLTQKNAAAVADICRRLDGIPLALELAAARVRALSVEKIAARLNDRFSLLTRGNASALPRQQTLRALIDWSFELLTSAERALLRRLAAFAGGWTLDAAEVVGAGGDIPKKDVLGLLANLVEKSLVTLEVGGERYRLLETVRQYAQERLSESGEEDSVRTRHLDFFLALAEQANPQLVGPDQGTWLALLDADAENLLAAHAACDRAEGGGELGLRLVHSTKLYLIYRGRLALLLRATLEALARPGARARTPARCRALHTAGQAAFFMGRYDAAQGYLEESLSIARQIEDKGRAAMVLGELGAVSTGQGDLVKARGYFEQALFLAQELGDKRALASTLNALAQLHRMEGKLDTAERLYQQMLALARELEDQETIAIGLLNLAMVSIDSGSRDHATEALAEALAIAEKIGSERAGQSGLDVSAGLYALGQDWERAAILFGAAEGHMARTGLHRDPTDEAFLAPLMAKARQAFGATPFSAAEATGHALAYDAAITQARAWLASPGG